MGTGGKGGGSFQNCIRIMCLPRKDEQVSSKSKF